MLVGCGVASVGSGEPPADPPVPIAIVGGNGPDYPGITRTVDTTGNARYLGEVLNQGDEVACNIRVPVNSYDGLGNLLSNPGNQQSGFTNLQGESFRFSSFATGIQDNCLSPGNRASFDIRNDFPPNRVANIEATTTCDGTLYAGCISLGEPFLPPVATLAIDGTVSEGVASDGRVVYTGTIRNQSPPDFATTYHVKIVFTARNAAGLVVDVACATIDGTDCPLPQGATPSNTGLGPDDFWSFTVPLSILPAETCPGCFSYIINQKPSL